MRLSLREAHLKLWGAVRATQTSRMRRLITGGIVSALSLVFLSVALYTQRATLVTHLREANGWLMLLALIGYPIGLMPVAFVWHEIMSGLGGCCDLRTNLHNYAVSAIPKRIPGAIWHVASRVVLYDACGVPPTLTVSATAIETLLLILTGLALFAIPVLAGEIPLRADLGRIVAALAVPTLAAMILTWKTLVRRFLALLGIDAEGVVGLTLGPLQLARVVAICVVGWLGGGVLLFLMSRAFIAVPMRELPAFIGIWGGAGAVSLIAGFLVQGLGLREITLAVLMSGYMPLSVSVAVALLFRVLVSVGEFAWSIVLARLSAASPSITRRDY